MNINIIVKHAKKIVTIKMSIGHRTEFMPYCHVSKSRTLKFLENAKYLPELVFFSFKLSCTSKLIETIYTTVVILMVLVRWCGSVVLRSLTVLFAVLSWTEINKIYWRADSLFSQSYKKRAVPNPASPTNEEQNIYLSAVLFIIRHHRSYDKNDANFVYYLISFTLVKLE